MTRTRRMSKKQCALLKDELDWRVKVERPRIAKLVSQAADFGDLPENADWDARLEEERFNEVRIKTIQEALENSEVVQTNVSKKRVDVDDKVCIEIDGKKKEYNVDSVDSPIGRAIYGKKVGYSASVDTPNGRIAVKILEIVKK